MLTLETFSFEFCLEPNCRNLWLASGISESALWVRTTCISWDSHFLLFASSIAHSGAQRILWETDANSVMYSLYWTKLKVFMGPTLSQALFAKFECCVHVWSRPQKRKCCHTETWCGNMTLFLIAVFAWCLFVLFAGVSDVLAILFCVFLCPVKGKPLNLSVFFLHPYSSCHPFWLKVLLLFLTSPTPAGVNCLSSLTNVESFKTKDPWVPFVPYIACICTSSLPRSDALLFISATSSQPLSCEFLGKSWTRYKRRVFQLQVASLSPWFIWPTLWSYIMQTSCLFFEKIHWRNVKCLCSILSALCTTGPTGSVDLGTFQQQFVRVLSVAVQRTRRAHGNLRKSRLRATRLHQ